MISKKDYRKERMQRHPTHLVIKWYHWSWRPRVFICHWAHDILEQRTKKVSWGKCKQ